MTWQSVPHGPAPETIRRIPEVNALTLVVGLAVIAIALGVRRLDRRLPAYLVAVLVAIIASVVLDLEVDGAVVALRSAVPPAPPVPSPPDGGGVSGSLSSGGDGS